jgi:hypothetical protein
MKEHMKIAKTRSDHGDLLRSLEEARQEIIRPTTLETLHSLEQTATIVTPTGVLEVVHVASAFIRTGTLTIEKLWCRQTTTYAARRERAYLSHPSDRNAPVKPSGYYFAIEPCLRKAVESWPTRTKRDAESDCFRDVTEVIHEAFIMAFRQALIQNRVASLTGVGTFEVTVDGSIAFTPHPYLCSLLGQPKNSIEEDDDF